jgi:hypothetical protein
MTTPAVSGGQDSASTLATGGKPLPPVVPGPIKTPAQALQQFHALQERINSVGEYARTHSPEDTRKFAVNLMKQVYSPQFKGLQLPDGSFVPPGGEKATPGPENMAAALVGLAKAGKALQVDLIEPDSVARSGNAWENWNLARYVNPNGAESFRAHERLVFDPKNGKILEHRIVAQDLDR